LNANDSEQEPEEAYQDTNVQQRGRSALQTAQDYRCTAGDIQQTQNSQAAHHSEDVEAMSPFNVCQA
jgi:hypothetical protein